MSPGGTAIAAWTDALSDGQYISFSGGTWSTPIQFGLNAANAVAAIDIIGNAFIAWNNLIDNMGYSSYIPFEGNLTTPDTVVNDNSLLEFKLAALTNKRGFITGRFTETDLIRGVSATYTLGVPPPPFPLPPSDISGRACNNKFAFQTDHIHIITWVKSPSIDVIGYYLRRNDVLIADIPATGPFIYYDHNRLKTDLYSLVAVSSSGESVPVNVIIK